MNGTITTDIEGINPVLWRLKREAEDEVKRLREELSQATNKLLAAEVLLMQINRPTELDLDQKLRNQLPSDLEWEKLKAAKVRLESELSQAERRLETELIAIRQHELATPSTRRPSRAKGDVPDLLEVAPRILPEYAERLDRIVESALNRFPSKHPAYVTALERLGTEMRALSEPLEDLIDNLSAVLEEGRITKVQRLELRLRLIELETKYQSAQMILKQLGVL